jgi:hypothetical protein
MPERRLGARHDTHPVLEKRRFVVFKSAPGWGTWDEARNRLNQILRRSSAYLSYGSRTTAYWEVNRYVSERARHFLNHAIRYDRVAPSAFAMSEDERGC